MPAAGVSLRASMDQRPAGGDVLPRAQVGEIQRVRLLAGAVAAAAELGLEGATVGSITGRARVSRRTFYELFANRDECVAAVLEDAVARVEHELAAAGVADLPWRERVREGLSVILGFLDREPALARVCVVHALRASKSVQDCRERVLARLVELVDEGRSQGARGEASGTLTAEGLVGAAFAIVYARVAHPAQQPLVELLGELMAMIALPYLGAAAARQERECKWPVVEREQKAQRDGCQQVPAFRTPRAAEDPLHGVPMRITYRTARVLEGVGELAHEGVHPSNRQIATFAGVGDPGQISKLLRRLERLGLLENHGGGRAHGEPNAWQLTDKGKLIIEGLRLPTAKRRRAS
jgi:AcrR family transcriptional regulator